MQFNTKTDNARTPLLFSIAVVSGSGQATFTAFDEHFTRISCQPPDDSATYSIELEDADGFGCWGLSCTDGTTASIEEDIWGSAILKIHGASVDGTYLVKIWYR